MTVFAWTIVIVGILFTAEEVRSRVCRRQIKRAEEEACEIAAREDSRERADTLLEAHDRARLTRGGDR